MDAFDAEGSYERPNEDSIVTVRYRVRSAAGDVIEEVTEPPLQFAQGSGVAIPAINLAVLEMRKGGPRVT